MSPERSNSGLDVFAASIWPSESTSLLLTDLQTRDLVLGYVGGALYSLHNRGAVMRTSVWRWGQWWSESCVSGVQWGLVRWWIQDSKGSPKRQCPSPQVLFKPCLALCWLMPRLKGREINNPSWLGSLKVKWQRPEINHHDHFFKKNNSQRVKHGFKLMTVRHKLKVLKHPLRHLCSEAYWPPINLKCGSYFTQTTRGSYGFSLGSQKA